MAFLEDGKPTLKLVLTTMRTFARAGVDWLSQRQIRRDFQGTLIGQHHLDSIANSQESIDYGLSKRNLTKGSDMFWPLPDLSGDKSYIAFFRPKLFGANGRVSGAKIELILLWRQRKTSAGFRFERGAGGASDRHTYNHMQITRQFETQRTGRIETSQPDYLCNGRPAIPIPPQVPFTNWFSALLALAGHQRDGKNGVVPAFDSISDFYDGLNYDQARYALETTVNLLVTES